MHVLWELRKIWENSTIMSSMPAAPAVDEDHPQAPPLVVLPSPSCCAEPLFFMVRKAARRDVGPGDQKQPKVKNIFSTAGKWKFEGFRSRRPNFCLQSTTLKMGEDTLEQRRFSPKAS